MVRYWDTNNDGVADKKAIFYSGVGVGRDGNVEHEQSGFLWGLDNWIYSTYNAFRFRWTPHWIFREPTAPNGASFGADFGRRREDVVHQCWWGARPGQLPVPDSVRQPDAGRRLRAGLRHRVACSRDRRYAGRDAACPPTARRTQPLHRDRRRRYRPWRSTPLRIFAAISCSPSLWGVSYPAREDRQDRGVDPTSQRHPARSSPREPIRSSGR